MRLGIILYLILLGLIAGNLYSTFNLSLWVVTGAMFLVLAGIVAVQYFINTRKALMLALSSCGVIGLVCAALGFAVPAWEVIFDGASSVRTGTLMPMFICALALYAVVIWLDGVTSETDASLDAIASFIVGPRLVVSFITAVVLCSATLLLLESIAASFESATSITKRFLTRGPIPPCTLLLFYWGVLILIGKWWNSIFMHRAVADWKQGIDATRLNTVNKLIENVTELSEETEGIDNHLTFLWRRHDESFVIPRYLSWVVPLLGFIGTVLGISLAADGIRGLIASDAGITGLSTELGSAIAPLGIAFDTTLIALSLSAVLTGLQFLVQRREERTLATLELQLSELSSAG